MQFFETLIERKFGRGLFFNSNRCSTSVSVQELYRLRQNGIKYKNQKNQS